MKSVATTDCDEKCSITLRPNFSTHASSFLVSFHCSQSHILSVYIRIPDTLSVGVFLTCNRVTPVVIVNNSRHSLLAYRMVKKESPCRDIYINCIRPILYLKPACKITGWPIKSKPLPNDQKIVLNRIKACH